MVAGADSAYIGASMSLDQTHSPSGVRTASFIPPTARTKPPLLDDFKSAHLMVPVFPGRHHHGCGFPAIHILVPENVALLSAKSACVIVPATFPGWPALFYVSALSRQTLTRAATGDANCILIGGTRNASNQQADPLWPRLHWGARLALAADLMALLQELDGIALVSGSVCPIGLPALQPLM